VKHGRRPEDELVAGAAAVGVQVSVECARKLRAFEGLLVARGVPAGLVAESDLSRIRRRHVLDCVRAAAVVRESDGAAYDVGSGAGLPGLVIACVCPWLRLTLVEPRRRRAAFLELAVERLELSNALVRAERIQDIHEPADLCFSRAFAPLPEAWAAALPRLRPGGRLVYFAGEGTGSVALLAGASAAEVVPAPVLESTGPLIIMTR
jgi:16S rRNA (guanine527-N7)-methyltransferase